jgi:hypothetical protein
MGGAAPAVALEVKSPDGLVRLGFEVSDLDAATACLIYSVTYRGTTRVAPSQMGFEFRIGALGRALQTVWQTETSNDTICNPVFGERSTAPELPAMPADRLDGMFVGVAGRSRGLFH